MFETLYRGIIDICHVGVYYKYCYVNLKATEQKRQTQSTLFTLGSNDGGREDIIFEGRFGFWFWLEKEGGRGVMIMEWMRIDVAMKRNKSMSYDELLSQNWRIHYSIWLLKRSSWSHLATGGIFWSLLSLEDAPEELLGGRLLWRWQWRLVVAPAGGL